DEIQECAACVAFWWLMLVLSCESPLVESLLHLVACPLLMGKITVDTEQKSSTQPESARR
ncbi:hypothetical protein L1R07_39265, partial [Klebsiella pneumoniae]